MPPDEPRPASGTSRPLPRVLLLLVAALLVARIGTGIWEERQGPPALPVAEAAADSSDRVAWVPIASAEDESRRAGKPILYEFSAEWCGPCRIMAREVFSDSAAAAQIAQWYVPVRVVDRVREQGRNPPEVERLQDAYRVNAFPTLVVAWPGKSDFRTTSGYGGEDRTMAWLAANAPHAPIRVVHGTLATPPGRP